MGRVYDALKRAESAPSANTSSNQPKGNSDNVMPFVPRAEHHHPWERTAFTGLPSVFDSASTAHTGEATGGPALPDGNAFRDAGATLDAVGSARAVEFPTRDISTARVEPHLVAITDPRSPECEQFRSLRTRILQAGERKRAFVITSANMGEGKTLTAVNLAWLLAQTDGATALIIDADLRKRIEAFRPLFESDPLESFLAWPSSEEPESFEAGLARVSPSAPELCAAIGDYWDASFAAEWARIEPLLAEAVDDARRRLAEHGVPALAVQGPLLQRPGHGTGPDDQPGDHGRRDRAHEAGAGRASPAATG